MRSKSFVSALNTSAAAAALVAFGVPGVQADGIDEVSDVAREVAQSTSATGQYEVISGRRSPKASLVLNGQVNKLLLFADDGENSDVFITDNDNSSTRFRLIGKGKFNENVTIGTRFEVQMESNSTTLVNLNNAERGLGVSGGAPANNGFAERYAEFTITHKQLGKLYLGQGDTASNGTSEVDNSGTGVIQYSGISDTAGGQLFRDDRASDASAATSAGGATGQFAGSQTVQSSFTNFDGLSRDDRIRYDTPTIAGFKASAGYVAGGRTNAALRYSGKIGGFKISGAAAYANVSSTSTSQEDQINGSLSVLHDSGISLTVAGGTRGMESGTREDPRGAYVKLGYIAKLFSFGTTRLGIDYAKTWDVAANGDEFTSYSFAAVQNIKDLGADFFFIVRNHELDTQTATDQDFDDVLVVGIGGRVKF